MSGNAGNEEYNELRSDIIGKLHIVENSAKETMNNGKCKCYNHFVNLILGYLEKKNEAVPQMRGGGSGGFTGINLAGMSPSVAYLDRP